MKYGHTFKQYLVTGEFPEQWVHMAISYQQLKKCIKRIQEELLHLGLNAQTLGHLLHMVETRKPGVERKEFAFVDNELEDDEVLHFLVTEDADGAESVKNGNYGTDSQIIPFHPKLLFAVDEETGEPLSATISPETKKYLRQLAQDSCLNEGRIVEINEDGSSRRSSESDDKDADSLAAGVTDITLLTTPNSVSKKRHRPKRRMIEVPLTTGSEFFNILQSEMTGLAQLQAEEQKKLISEVGNLGKIVSKITEPNRTSAKHDLQKWRQIFELYLKSQVFFSTTEQHHGAHNASEAERLLQNFQQELQESHITNFKKSESRTALEQFLKLNSELLKNLRFQEINRTATTKILKKFDKHTSLSLSNTFPEAIRVSLLTQDVAQVVCQQISMELLSVVPQLEDYTCPVCFSISWRPIRVTCGHVFCIRCMIVMQRENRDECPLCRDRVVMKADATNLDPTLAKFLKKYFPNEVKEKQKDNQRLAGIDQYGEAFDDKCITM